MDLSKLPGGESHPIYQRVDEENLERHYDFLNSMIQAAIDSQQTRVSHALIRALNLHAIAGLHPWAGLYRSQKVNVYDKDGAITYKPPPITKVTPLMKKLVFHINEQWPVQDAVPLAAYALWGINNIHPFVNGNGRTARAVCYFILCAKLGGLLPGRKILPDILRAKNIHPEYVCALKKADGCDLEPLTELVERALTLQIREAG